MLVKCPECDLQVSDKAQLCPHCGFPLKISEPKSSKKTKRKRLPNGFGQISLIKNQNLRKPYRAMVTVSKDEKGRPICKPLKPDSYFKTYNEAYEALVEFNKNPYNIEQSITVNELYSKWADSYFKSLNSKSSIRTIESAWNHSKQISKMRVCDVRSRHIKGVIDDCESPNTKSRIKSLFNLMFDYAVEFEIADKNYARAFDISKNTRAEIDKLRRAHIAFNDKELQCLWKNIDIEYVDLILIQCYMGWRPQELCLLKTAGLNIKDKIITGGMKTEVGTDRVVPIHPNIYNMVMKYYDPNKEYLFKCTDGSPLTYDKYRRRFESIIQILNLNKDHRAHDPRSTFITLCKQYNVDEYAIKYLAGHAVNDVTEKIYTTRKLEWLISELSKIK